MDFPTAMRRAMGDMSMSALSRESGVAISTISRHCAGQTYPSWSTLTKYEQVLPKLSKLLRRNGRRQ